MLFELTGFVEDHDPVIVKEGDLYYCFSTHGFISSSPDMKKWKLEGRVFNGKNFDWVNEYLPKNGGDLWAPELVKRNGKWRLYYAVSAFGKRTSVIGLAENKTLDMKSPLYKWEDCGCVIKSSDSDNFNAIDPAVCRDQEGKDYLVYGSFWGGLFILPLKEDGHVEVAAKAVNLANRGTDPDPVEGGFIFFRKGYYYLFASYDFCCRGTASTYHIVILRSKSITGPYYDSIGNDAFHSGGDVLRNGLSHKRWAGPGHNTVFEDTDGRTYLVYHAYDRLNEGKNNLQIEELFWDEDGWPYLK